MRNLVRKIPHILFGSDRLTGYWMRPGTPIFSPVNEERGEKDSQRKDSGKTWTELLTLVEPGGEIL